MAEAPESTEADGSEFDLSAAAGGGSVVETVEDDGRRRVPDDDAHSHLRRMSYFMLFRLGLLAVFTLLAGFSSYILGDSKDPFAERLTWTTIALGYAMTLIFAWRMRAIRSQPEGRKRKQWTRRLAWGQTIFDILLAAVVVQVSGGAESGFVFLYLIAVLGAATMGDRRQTWAAAGACALIYLTMSLLQASGVVAPTWTSGEVATIRSSALWLGVVRTLAAMAAISMLSAYLNTQLLSSVSQIGSLRVLNENIVRSLTSGLVTIDREGRVLYANPMALDILGMDRDIRAEDCERVLPGVRDHLDDSGGPLTRFEISLERPGGRHTHLGLNCCPLRDNQGRFLGHVVNFQDVTGIRELEHRLRRNERLAAVGELASSVAHEVRNPLAAISGCAELLATADLGEEDRKLLGVIRRESGRLSSTVNDLLAFTRPKAPELVDVDLSQSVREITEAFRADPTNAQVETRVEVLEQPVWAHVDPSQFSQVVWNLLRNGVEAMEEGGELRVTLDAIGDRARLEIRDTGMGIPADQLDRIFEPFFSTKKEGSGIGLALIHRIVQELGGNIDVDSVEGEGTTFTVKLPRVER
jgi:two-component system sensor histidine kinase PilS (NtrC family)